MKFNKYDLSKFANMAENREIVIIEGKNGMGQKFKTMGCFMTDKNEMGDYLYIQDQSFALFQGEYNKNGEKQYCAFHIDPDIQYMTSDCLFVDTIKTRNGQIVYKNPNFQRVQAFGFYNKIILPQDIDYTPSQIHNTLLMHIGKPMTYKKNSGTLMSLLTRNNVTFAVFSTGTQRIDGVIKPFDVHPSNNASKNLKDYTLGIEHEQ